MRPRSADVHCRVKDFRGYRLGSKILVFIKIPPIRLVKTSSLFFSQRADYEDFILRFVLFF